MTEVEAIASNISDTWAIISTDLVTSARSQLISWEPQIRPLLAPLSQ
ncbi:hypothetical protein [Nodosilinea sp. FACHB-13]|nr:hypothetical protein [Nodosilinea sp. FACHB-13]MBD2107986.1 hypothetical protein [Nodosilinea sp. FACHB-13]MBD2114767.1 hypothetical protein [Nodosilinea sp. FACHB-141]